MVTSRQVIANYHTESISYRSGQSDSDKDRDNIRAAKEMGLDGWVLNAFNGSQADGQFSAFISAADAVGAADFKFVLSTDLNWDAVPPYLFTPTDIRATIKRWGKHPHYLQVNGKPLLHTYSGEQHDNAWWQNNVIGPLNAGGFPVTFIPNFDRDNPNDADPSYQNWSALINKYPVVDGLFSFIIPGSVPFYSTDPRIGRHMWSILEAREALAQALRDRGKMFMAEVKPYYWAVCSSVRQYYEFQGGRGIENQWRSIIEKQKPDIVQLITWNDHGESTHYEPSRYMPLSLHDSGIRCMPHLGFYELTKYFIQWFKTGVQPTITKDALFAFYRTTRKNATPTDDSSHCDISLDPDEACWGDVQDNLYITTMLTAPAELRVKTGTAPLRTFALPAGMVHTDMPFRVGAQTFELWRNGVKLAGLSGQSIVSNPPAYNFHVFGGYAVAGGSSSANWLPSDKWKTGYVADWFR